MKKMLFVYNPRSGKGLIRSQLSGILEMFSEAGYDITVYPTKKAMDGCTAVQNRAGDFDLIVCSGGDGTLDEVVTGLVNSGIRRPIGYIPAGSTNDFANSIGIPKQMEMAAKIIVDGNAFQCDLGRMNQEYFVYVAAFGMFTDVSYQTPQDLKNVFGHTAYLLEGMKRVGTWKTHTLRIESEEFSGEGEFLFGMITNSSSVGGIKGITGKNVEMNDGLFEVMLVRNPKNIVHLQEIISAVLTGEDSDNSLVRFKTRRLEIFSDKPVAWTRDGENGGEHTHVILENRHLAFDIMAGFNAEQAALKEPKDAVFAAAALEKEASSAEAEAAEAAEAEETAEAEAAETGKTAAPKLILPEYSVYDSLEITAETLKKALEKLMNEIAAEFTGKVQNEQI